MGVCIHFGWEWWWEVMMYDGGWYIVIFVWEVNDANVKIWSFFAGEVGI